MSNPYNTISVVGRVGKSPEVKATPKGIKLARFSICERKLKRDDKDRWHQCVAFGRYAELIEKYVKTGRNIVVKATLTYNVWKDNAGNQRERAELMVEDFGLLDAPKPGTPAPDADYEPEPEPMPEAGDDLPFE